MEINTLRILIENFCLEFLQFPYLCYTEHGLHARFYYPLCNAIPLEEKYLRWEGKKICTVQKEYPTADSLDKSRRQHWDIAIIKSPPSPMNGKTPSYDYLKLYAAIEFGLNEPCSHLKDDVNRMCHKNSNVDNKFIIHLYRISKGISKRDWSPNSERIITPEQIIQTIQGKAIDIYYAISDSTGKYEPGVWLINNNGVNQVPVR